MTRLQLDSNRRRGRSGGTLLSWNLRDSPRATPVGCPFGGCPARRPSITLQQCGRQSICLSVQPSAVLRLSPDKSKSRRSGEKVIPERFPRETPPQRRCFSGAEADQTSHHRSNRPHLRNTRQATNCFLHFDRLANPTAGGQRRHRTPHPDTRPECGGEAHRPPRLVRTIESFSCHRLSARDDLIRPSLSPRRTVRTGLSDPFYLRACRDRTPKPRSITAPPGRGLRESGGRRRGRCLPGPARGATGRRPGRHLSAPAGWRRASASRAAPRVGIDSQHRVKVAVHRRGVVLARGDREKIVDHPREDRLRADRRQEIVGQLATLGSR